MADEARLIIQFEGQGGGAAGTTTGLPISPTSQTPQPAGVPGVSAPASPGKEQSAPQTSPRENIGRESTTAGTIRDILKQTGAGSLIGGIPGQLLDKGLNVAEQIEKLTQALRNAQGQPGAADSPESSVVPPTPDGGQSAPNDQLPSLAQRQAEEEALANEHPLSPTRFNPVETESPAAPASVPETPTIPPISTPAIVPGAGATGAAGAAGGAGAGAGAASAGAAGAAAVAVPIAAAIVASVGFNALLAKASYDFAASRVSEFSPDVARAAALNDVREITRNLEFAQTLGPIVGSINTATGGIRDDIERAAAPFVKDILEKLETLVLLTETTTKILGPAIELLGNVNDGIIQLENVNSWLRQINKWLENRADNNYLLDSFTNFEHLPLPAGYVEGQERPLELNFNGPILGLN